MNAKQKLLGAAMALSMGMSGAAHAFSVNTGFGTISNLDGFDWAPGSALGQNSLPLSGAQSSFTVYSQASLSSYLSNNIAVGDSNLNSLYEVTYEVGFGELGQLIGQVPGVAASAFFQFDPNSTVNFFNVYYDSNSATFANALTGAGYADGQLILSGVVVASDGGINQTGGTFLINFTQTGLLDQNGGDDWGGQLSFGGSGSNTAVIDLQAQNQQFNFFNNLDISALTTLTILNSNANTPFNLVDPALVVAGQAVDIPTVNGDLNCVGTTSPCDFLFQNDGAQKFDTIPEPNLIALLGVGLLGMGAAARRRTV